MSVCVDFILCKSDSSVPVILFISKMFHVDPSALPEKRTQSVTGTTLTNNFTIFLLHRTLSAEEMKEKRETIIKNLQSENKLEGIILCLDS